MTYRLDESHLTGEAGEVGKSPESAPLMYSGSKVGSVYCAWYSIEAHFTFE